MHAMTPFPRHSHASHVRRACERSGSRHGAMRSTHAPPPLSRPAAAAGDAAAMCASAGNPLGRAAAPCRPGNPAPSPRASVSGVRAGVAYGVGFVCRLWEPRGVSRCMRSGTYALRRLSTSTASAQRRSVASTYRWRNACRGRTCVSSSEEAQCMLSVPHVSAYPYCRGSTPAIAGAPASGGAGGGAT